MFSMPFSIHFLGSDEENLFENQELLECDHLSYSLDLYA